jgi:hypothetical protein
VSGERAGERHQQNRSGIIDNQDMMSYNAPEVRRRVVNTKEKIV